MKDKDKSVKVAWFSTCESGGRGNYTRNKKHSADVKELNSLAVSEVAKAIIININVKVNTKDGFDSDNESKSLTSRRCTLVRSPTCSDTMSILNS